MDVKALLKDEEGLAAAISISQALIEVKIEVLFSFWLSLEEKLKAAGFDSIEFLKYSRKKAEAYYKKGRRDHGLMLPLPELLGLETLACYIGVNYNRVYYGFVILDGGHTVTKEAYPGFVLLSEILKGVDQNWTVGTYLFGWKYSKRQIEFANFDTPDTLALIDPAKRDAYLDELVEEVTAAIDQFYAACEKDPRLQDEAAW